MARTNALSILATSPDKDQLSEIYGQVIEAVQKGAVSEQIKNTNYSGDATSGSVEISRFKNAEVKAYGTARTAGKGDALDNSGKVTINVDVDKEIVEEVAKKDIDLHGVAGVAQRRAGNHVLRMTADLDRAFFAEAENAGSNVAMTGLTEIEDKIEKLIQSLETLTNDWVDGVDREMLVLTLKPAVYAKLRDFIDVVSNPNIDSSQESITMFRGVRVFSNTRQTKEAICMIDGAVGQLIKTDVYSLEKIPLSNDMGLCLFYSRGTKAVTPDLIKYATVLP